MSDDSKFPECFPRNPKICSVQGNAFFDCIDKHADKTDELDTSANARALAACLVLILYKIECTILFMINASINFENIVPLTVLFFRLRKSYT